MLSQAVETAVNHLQQQALQATDLYEIDRIERALDELLRNPLKADPAHFQVRSARSHANRVLQDRRTILGPRLPLVLDTKDGEVSDARVIRGFSVSEDGYDIVEFEMWLATSPSLSALERRYLQALGDGEDASSLATVHDRPITIMSQRLSRARRKGRLAYEAEVRSA